MAKLTAHMFSISVDGFGAGPRQNLQNPLGEGGSRLHAWMTSTRTFQRLIGKEGGATGADDDIAASGFVNVGAWLIGRNMFGPIRGPWPDESWKGWWGDNPPFHTPVFVLTHRARAPIAMAGGTTFYFVTEGIEAACKQALAAAGGKDVRVGGGVATLRQLLSARLLDELRLAIAPTLLGEGELLFAGLNLPQLGYQCTAHTATPNATHVVLSKSA